MSVVMPISGRIRAQLTHGIRLACAGLVARARGRRTARGEAALAVPGARNALAATARRGVGQQRLARRRALRVPVPAPGDRDPGVPPRARGAAEAPGAAAGGAAAGLRGPTHGRVPVAVLRLRACLLYTSDAADERSSVDLGGR